MEICQLFKWLSSLRCLSCHGLTPVPSKRVVTKWACTMWGRCVAGLYIWLCLPYSLRPTARLDRWCLQGYCVAQSAYSPEAFLAVASFGFVICFGWILIWFKPCCRYSGIKVTQNSYPAYTWHLRTLRGSTAQCARRPENRLSVPRARNGLSGLLGAMCLMY